MYLVRYKQVRKDRTSVKKAMRDELQLGYPGILAKISKGIKLGVIVLG